MSQPTVPALTARLDAGAFEAISATLYDRHPGWFHFNLPMGAFEVTAPPRVAFLSPSERTRPGEDISFALEAKLTLEQTVMRFSITLYAELQVVSQAIQIAAVRVSADTGSTMLNGLLNACLGVLFQHLAAKFDGLTLPPLHHLFSHDMEHVLSSAQVVDVGGYAVLETSAAFGTGDAVLAPAPLRAEHGLGKGAWAQGTIELVVPVPGHLALHVKEVAADVGGKLAVVLTDVEEVEQHFKGLAGATPRFLEKALGSVEERLGHGTGDRFSASPLKLFDLPTHVPGTELPLDVRFAEPGGLSLDGDMIGARVVVQASPGVTVATPEERVQHGLTPVTANFVSAGEGRPIVLVHGWSLDLSYWKAQIEAFSPDYRCVAYDWRGMGGTPGGDLPYDMEQLSRDLLRFLDEQGLERVALSGHSLGGDIILRFAVEHPDRVAALVCADTPPPGIDPPLGLQASGDVLGRLWSEKRVEAILSPRAWVLEALAPSFRDMFWSPAFQKANPEAVSAWQAQWVKNHLAPLWTSTLAQRTRASLEALIPARVTCPGLVIRGEVDTLVSAEDAAALQALLRGPLHTVPSAGHMSPCEQPQDFNEAVRQFLAEVYPAG